MTKIFSNKIGILGFVAVVASLLWCSMMAYNIYAQTEPEPTATPTPIDCSTQPRPVDDEDAVEWDKQCGPEEGRVHYYSGCVWTAQTGFDGKAYQDVRHWYDVDQGLDAPSEAVYAKFYDAENDRPLTHTYTYRSVNGWDSARHSYWSLQRNTERGDSGWQNYQAIYASELRDFRRHLHALYAPIDRPTVRLGLGNSQVSNVHANGADWTYVYLGQSTPQGIKVWGHRNGTPCWHLIP